MEFKLVSPVDQATANIVVSTPSTDHCDKGEFVNQTMIRLEDSALTSKCSKCPPDTFQPYESHDFACRPCAPGSTTVGVADYRSRLSGYDGEGEHLDGLEDNFSLELGYGSSICFTREENLVPNGLLAFGYVVMSVVLFLALGFAVWAIVHRNDPVVSIRYVSFANGTVCVYVALVVER